MLTMIPIVVAIVVIDATLSDESSETHIASYCRSTYHRTCQAHTRQNSIYCANDGKKYNGLCAYLLATCEYHVHVIGYGENCTKTHSTMIHSTNSTPRPHSHFERGLYGEITHGIDDRLKTVKAINIPVAIAKDIFTKQDHAHKIYVRNKNCWAYDLILT